jgi:DNA-binding response OmpR family regulator
MAEQKTSVLVVDDEDEILELVYDELAKERFLYDLAADSDVALDKMENNHYDVALLDIILPQKSGIDILKIIKEYYQTIAVVMMTGVKDIDVVVEAMKLGASDYIVKPFSVDRLENSINAALKEKETREIVSEIIPCARDYFGDLDDNNFRTIDAIAQGVEAQVDNLGLHSKAVTQKTLKVAKLLAIPMAERDKWENARIKHEVERDEKIVTSLRRLKQNPLIKTILDSSPTVRNLPSYYEK